MGREFHLHVWHSCLGIGILCTNPLYLNKIFFSYWNRERSERNQFVIFCFSPFKMLKNLTLPASGPIWVLQFHIRTYWSIYLCFFRCLFLFNLYPWHSECVSTHYILLVSCYLYNFNMVLVLSNVRCSGMHCRTLLDIPMFFIFWSLYA